MVKCELVPLHFELCYLILKVTESSSLSMTTAMLLLSEGEPDCLRHEVTHVEDENSDRESAGERTEKRMSLQRLLLLQQWDTKPIPQSQLVHAYLTAL